MIGNWSCYSAVVGLWTGSFKKCSNEIIGDPSIYKKNITPSFRKELWHAYTTNVNCLCLKSALKLRQVTCWLWQSKPQRNFDSGTVQVDDQGRLTKDCRFLAICHQAAKCQPLHCCQLNHRLLPPSTKTSKIYLKITEHRILMQSLRLLVRSTLICIIRVQIWGAVAVLRRQVPMILTWCFTESW